MPVVPTTHCRLNRRDSCLVIPGNSCCAPRTTSLQAFPNENERRRSATTIASPCRSSNYVSWRATLELKGGHALWASDFTNLIHFINRLKKSSNKSASPKPPHPSFYAHGCVLDSAAARSARPRQRGIVDPVGTRRSCRGFLQPHCVLIPRSVPAFPLFNALPCIPLGNHTVH